MSGGSQSDGEKSSSSDAAWRAPAPVAADVGIVAALGIEVGFLIDRLTNVRKYSGPHHSVVEGEYGGKLVALVVAGVGRHAARQGTQLLLDGHHPRWVFSVGFGGSLDPALGRNALVLPSEVLDLDGVRTTLEQPVPPESIGLGTRSGRLLTVDQIIRTAAEKAELRARYDADLVDMETSAVAAVCEARKVRFLAMRVISDDATADLPPEVAALMTKPASYQVGAALRAIWRRPSRIKDFWALHEHAQEAADRLAVGVTRLVERLA